MLNKHSDDHVYFIEAAKDRATYIARKWVSPGEAPVGLTEKEYNAYRPIIEHYVKAGTIMLHEPGTTSSAKAAKDVKAEHVRRSKIVVGEMPPSPRELTPVAEPNADVNNMSTFSVPGEDEDDNGKLRCVVKTSKGDRCKADAISKHLVCTIHQRMLNKGKKLEDTAGNRVLKNGKDIKTA